MVVRLRGQDLRDLMQRDELAVHGAGVEFGPGDGVGEQPRGQELVQVPFERQGYAGEVALPLGGVVAADPDSVKEPVQVVVDAPGRDGGPHRERVADQQRASDLVVEGPQFVDVGLTSGGLGDVHRTQPGTGSCPAEALHLLAHPAEATQKPVEANAPLDEAGGGGEVAGLDRLAAPVGEAGQIEQAHLGRLEHGADGGLVRAGFGGAGLPRCREQVDAVEMVVAGRDGPQLIPGRA